MKRLAALLLFLCPLLVCAEDLPLDVKGPGVKTYTVIEKFPATVSAPSGASWYDWHYPSVLEAEEDEGPTLTVKGAPKGAHVVRVRARYFDLKTGKVTSKTGTLTLTVGEGPAPVPPVPNPSDPLTQAVQAAFALETDAAKVTQLADLAQVYRQGAVLASDPAYKTWDNLFEKVSQFAQAHGVSGKLLAVQKAVQAEALRTIPQSANLSAAITAADRTAAAAFYGRAAQVLEGVTK